MMFRIASFLVWAVVAAAAMFWALRLAVRPASAPAYASAEQGSLVASVDLSRLLGATPAAAPAAAAPPPPEASRFQLAGVVAPRTEDSPEGIALIAIDGKPPKHFRVGGKVDGDWVLQSVGRRSASIGPAQGEPIAVLELPALLEPSTGRLPPPPTQ